jgi:dTDP-4-amino-4,6-dideoxygalactose transaminase
VIALRALGIGVGDEVITSPFSFFATAESISTVGAKPIFVDIDPMTFNLDPKLIEAAITKKTKAIMPVHLFGLPADMVTIMKIAKEYGLKVIEDAAQSFGASYQTEDANSPLVGKQTGSVGDAGAFSFYPTKNLGAYGDAGLLTTQDDAVAEEARKLRNHGSVQRYHNETLGYNSRLDGMQAAILRVKLPHLDSWNKARFEVAKRYSELLKDVPGITTPLLHKGHVFHQYTIRVANGNRDELQAKLKEKDISTIVYYPFSQDQLPVYKGQYGDFPESHKLAKEVLSLPIWPELGPGVQADIASILVDCLAR